MSKPYVVNESSLPLEGWDDVARGTTLWRTMISADIAPTDTFSAGIAYFAPGQTLEPHRHSHAEVYFILEGELEITIEGTTHVAKPNTALFIPGNAEHGTLNASSAPARIFYCFATDRFSDVQYQFSAPAKPVLARS
ncbi:MAG: cupin domain-containing protein [Alphaproteobacteria bacterium]|nr:cupin domain-containing protein [Alphaproteobacteria bacterium]